MWKDEGMAKTGLKIEMQNLRAAVTRERKRAEYHAEKADRLLQLIESHHALVTRDDWSADERLWAAAGLSAPEMEEAA
jgi:hypothetical protein